MMRAPLLRALAVVWVVWMTAANKQHPHNEALKVADYVREVRDQLQHDGQPAAAAPTGKGWPDAAAKAAAMERIAAAAEERRLAIRRHYGLEGTPDAERWLDEAIGFTNPAAKAPPAFGPAGGTARPLGPARSSPSRRATSPPPRRSSRRRSSSR